MIFALILMTLGSLYPLPRCSLPVSLCYHYMTGYLIIALVSLLLVFFHIPLYPIVVIPVVAIVGLIGIGRIYAHRQRLASLTFLLPKIPKDTITLLLAIMLVSFSTTVLISAVYWPQTLWWDSMAMYDFRARVFADSHTMADYLSLVKETDRESYAHYYYSYLPTTSLVRAWGYMIQDPTTSVLEPLFFICLLVVFVVTARAYMGRRLAFFMATLLATVPVLAIFAPSGYINIPAITYLFTAWAWCVSVEKRRSRAHMILAIGYVLMSLLIRHIEPYSYLIAGYFVFQAIANKSKSALWLGLVYVGLPSLVQSIQQAHFQRDVLDVYGSGPLRTHTYGVVFQNIFHLETHLNAAIYVVSELWSYMPFFFVWAVACIMGVLKRSYTHIAGSYMVFGILMITYAGTYVLSLQFSWWNQIGSSFHRNFMVIFPFLFLSIGQTLSTTLPQKQS